MSNVRYVAYHCPGCQLHITRTVGKTGEFLRAMKKRRNFCATSGKVETMTRVHEVFR